MCSHCPPAQACSILYKTRLPVLLVFNKVDVARHEFALDWMADFENFHQVRLDGRLNQLNSKPKEPAGSCDCETSHQAQLDGRL